MNGVGREPGLQKGKKNNWAQLGLTWGCCAWELDLSFFCSNLKDLGMRWCYCVPVTTYDKVSRKGRWSVQRRNARIYKDAHWQSRTGFWPLVGPSIKVVILVLPYSSLLPCTFRNSPGVPVKVWSSSWLALCRLEDFGTLHLTAGVCCRALSCVTISLGFHILCL